MKIITWCYNSQQQQISFDSVTRNRNGVAIPVDELGNLHSCRHKKGAWISKSKMFQMWTSYTF